MCLSSSSRLTKYMSSPLRQNSKNCLGFSCVLESTYTHDMCLLLRFNEIKPKHGLLRIIPLPNNFGKPITEKKSILNANLFSMNKRVAGVPLICLQIFPLMFNLTIAMPDDGYSNDLLHLSFITKLFDSKYSNKRIICPLMVNKEHII